MICFFGCAEITRPLAAVAKYAIGLNRAPFAVLRLRRLTDLDLGFDDITASPFRRARLAYSQQHGHGLQKIPHIGVPPHKIRADWLCLKVVNIEQTRLSQWTKVGHGPDSKFRFTENSTTAAVPEVPRAHVDDWRSVIQDGP